MSLVKIIETAAMPPTELDQLSCSLDHGTTLGSSREHEEREGVGHRPGTGRGSH